MKSFTRTLTLALCGLLVAGSACGQQPVIAAPDPQPAVTQSAQQSLGELEQLVAPIALYPDELVAQLLTASTYPVEVVEASRWTQQHPGLEGRPLADAVDQQPWDPSVKALTQFPSVLDNMNENLSWTSALGDAYVNEPQDAMSAVQALRKRAQASGTLKSTSQQSITIEDDTIVIEPANPDLVYVPAYDPWLRLRRAAGRLSGLGRLRLNFTPLRPNFTRQNSAGLRPSFTRRLLRRHLAPSCRVPMAVSIRAPSASSTTRGAAFGLVLSADSITAPSRGHTRPAGC